jgi:hypothetical protein
LDQDLEPLSESSARSRCGLRMIRLFTSHYPEKCATRLGDLQACMKCNIGNSALDFVCLLLEGVETPYPTEHRLQVRAIFSRPTYQDFFDWANELCTSPDDVTLIANSDVFFDKSILALAETLKSNQCVALSRWDLQPNAPAQLFDRSDSQDVWVFKGPIRPVFGDFLVGVPRCDNRILHELRKVGYEVINPAFSVRAYHLHFGERAEYPKIIDGPHVAPPYEYLWPHNLMSLLPTLWYRLRHPESKLGWRIDWRRLQRTLPWRSINRLKRLLMSNER